MQQNLMLNRPVREMVINQTCEKKRNKRTKRAVKMTVLRQKFDPCSNV